MHEQPVEIQIASAEFDNSFNHDSGSVDKVHLLERRFSLKTRVDDDRQFSASEDDAGALLLDKLIQYEDEVSNNRLLVSCFNTVDNVLHQVLHLGRGNDGLDASAGERVLVQFGLDASAASEDSTPHFGVGFSEIGQNVVGGHINHAYERHIISTTLRHVFLEGVSRVTGANYEVYFGSRKVACHLTENWATVFASAENGMVSVRHLRVHLDDSVDVVLVLGCPV